MRSFLSRGKVSISSLGSQPRLLLRVRRVVCSRLGAAVQLKQDDNMFTLMGTAVGARVPKTSLSQYNICLQLVGIDDGIVLDPRAVLFHKGARVTERGKLRLRGH